MYKIEIADTKTRGLLLQYEGSIPPVIGDIYAGVNFLDGQARMVESRLLFPRAENYLTVYVKYAYPELVPAQKEVHELTETEESHIVQLTPGLLS